MTKKLVVSNQKGGVGKTSVTFHLAGALAEEGHRVLLIDTDQQGNLSSTLLDNIYRLNSTITDIFLHETPAADVVKKTGFENIDIIPSNLLFSKVDLQLAGEPEAHYLLSESLKEIEDIYSYVIIDTPPNLGLSTRAALIAAQSILIPTECHDYAMVGISQLLHLVKQIKRRANPDLDILGYLVTKFRTGTRLETQFLEDFKSKHKQLVFQIVIKNSIKYAEATDVRQPITFYLPKSEHAQAFKDLVKEIKNHE